MIKAIFKLNLIFTLISGFSHVISKATLSCLAVLAWMRYGSLLAFILAGPGETRQRSRALSVGEVKFTGQIFANGKAWSHLN